MIMYKYTMKRLIVSTILCGVSLWGRPGPVNAGDGKTWLFFKGAFDGPRHDEYCRMVEECGIKVVHTSRWFNAVSVVGSPPAIRRAARCPVVCETRPVARFRRRELPGPVSSPRYKPLQRSDAEYGLAAAQSDLIGIPAVHQTGYRGAGMRIGVFDTGFRLDHRCFGQLNVVAQYDFVNGDSVVADQPGDPAQQDQHGTKVLSLLAGYDPGYFLGTAWEAEFVLAKTEDIQIESVTEEDNWIRALEWAESLQVDIVTSSLGYIDWYTYPDLDGNTALCTKAADLAVGKGLCLVVSAGNEGNLAWHYITAPADGDSVIAVGSVNLLGAVSAFSSRGPTADGRIKPDLAACGEFCYTADPYVPDGYVPSSGTSMAAPQVAGACALLRQMHPGWQPMDIRQALRATASQADRPDTLKGWGVINAAAAAGLGINRPDPRAPDRMEVTLYPVPGGRHLSVTLHLPRTGTVRLALYSLSGACLRRYDLGLVSAGPFTAALDLPDRLAAGLYVMGWDQGTGNRYHRFSLVGR